MRIRIECSSGVFLRKILLFSYEKDAQNTKMAAFWLLMNMVSSGFQCPSTQFRYYANANAISTINCIQYTHIHIALSPFPNEAICLIGRMFQHICLWYFMFYNSIPESIQFYRIYGSKLIECFCSPLQQVHKHSE